MRGGAVSGFLVVALSLLGVWGIFTLYSTFVGNVTVAQAPFLIVGFGFGASFVALFAQLGGGIYTKAADVGSDLVGKVEKGIPEDDPRNAGVDRGPRRRQRRRLRRPRRRPVRVDRRREHRRDDPGRRRLRDRRRRRLAQPGGLDLLPARRPRLRPAGHDRGDLLRPRQGNRGPDEHAQPRLLGDDHPVRGRAGHRDLRDDEHRRRRPAPTASQPGSGSSWPASSAWRPASPSSTSPSTTPPARSARSRRSPRRPRPARRPTSSAARPSASRRPP